MLIKYHSIYEIKKIVLKFNERIKTTNDIEITEKVKIYFNEMKMNKII